MNHDLTSTSASTSLAGVQKGNLLFGLVAVALGAGFWGRAGFVAATAGVALACGNFWLVERFARRAGVAAALSDGPSPLAGLMARLAFKSVGLLGVVAILVWGLKLSAAPFALGTSVLVLSIVVFGVRNARVEAA